MRTQTYILLQKLRCSKCGRILAGGATHKIKADKWYFYYRCEDCKNNIKEEIIEKSVKKLLSDILEYDNEQELIEIIRGTSSPLEDVKQLYLDEFEDARLEYNSKQSRPSRMIDNYFDNVSNNEKKDLACEIIIELGDISDEVLQTITKEDCIKLWEEN